MSCNLNGDHNLHHSNRVWTPNEYVWMCSTNMKQWTVCRRRWAHIVALQLLWWFVRNECDYYCQPVAELYFCSKLPLWIFMISYNRFYLDGWCVCVCVFYTHPTHNSKVTIYLKQIDGNKLSASQWTQKVHILYLGSVLQHLQLETAAPWYFRDSTMSSSCHIVI